MHTSPNWKQADGARIEPAGRVGGGLPIVAVAVSLAILLAGGPPAEAAFPGGNGKIVFTGNDGDTEIFVMEPDGSGVTQLTSNGANDVQAAWSASGTKIAFVSNRDGDAEIFVMDADGSNQTQLTANRIPDLYPAWSPDGSRLTFTRDLDSDPFISDLEIFVMDADGSGQTQLTSDEFGKFGSEWSPDGTKIAFHRGRADGGVGIVVMNADGSGPTDISPAGGANDFDPSWSPDGSKLAFSLAFAGIGVMNADGSGRITLATGGGHEPVWSPDGTKIVFVRVEGSTPAIFVMDADGSDLARLIAATSPTGGILLRPDWQPIAEDTDGDGLLDAWETDGLDVDGDGTVDVDLPAMGADPEQKDVFVEVDSMPLHELSQSAIDKVVDAFWNAPQRIHLHVDNGPGSRMNRDTGATWGSLSEASTVPYDGVLGTFSGDLYDWSEFDSIKASEFLEEREPVFHYVVSADQHGSPTNTRAGIARGIGASDFIVSLGVACPWEPECTDALQAGTFMHELGHNLGLMHGGQDAINRKPNYLSVMNYAFQQTGLQVKTGGLIEDRFDYSRFSASVLPSLQETALSELRGFGSISTLAGDYYTVKACPDGSLGNTLIAGAVDWNCDAATQIPLLSVDVNGEGGAAQTLTSFEDWGSLVFDGGAIGDLGSAVTLPQRTELIEPPFSELQELANALLDADSQPPAVTCSANPLRVWPPNHTLVDVAASVEVTDEDSGPGGFRLVSVASDQADAGLSSEDVPNDIQGWELDTPDTTGKLRAERDDTVAAGRAYTLAYEGRDRAGNTATCQVTVLVPHDRRP